MHRTVGRLAYRSTEIIYTVVRIGLRPLGRERRQRLIGSRLDWVNRLPMPKSFMLNPLTGTVVAFPAAFQMGNWEKNVTRLVKNLHGKLFIDVGANAGYYSWILQRNFKKIVAIEPVPENVQELKKTFASSQNVTIIEAAASDMDGEQELFLAAGANMAWHTIESSMTFDPKSTKLESPVHWEAKTPEMMVRSVTLDTVIGDGIADLVKIDVEGGEWKVLEGMRKALSEKRVRVLIVELHDKSRRAELMKLFPMPYLPYWLDDDHLMERLP